MLSWWRRQNRSGSPNNNVADASSALRFQLESLGLLFAWMILNTLCSYFNRILFHNAGWHFPFFLTMSHGITVSIIYFIFIKVCILFCMARLKRANYAG
jgi:hypothetical protein